LFGEALFAVGIDQGVEDAVEDLVEVVRLAIEKAPRWVLLTRGPSRTYR
jgi:hypothetical protein